MESVTKADEVREKQAARKRSEASTMGNRVRRRTQWEAADAAPGSVGRMDNAHGFVQGGEKMSVGQIYEARGWSEAPQSGTHHPRMYDRQLPGLEDPYAAPTPPRWEDLDSDTQTKIARNVKLRTGVDHDFMKRSFGAQLDQAYLRADFHTPADEARVRPAGQNFYTDGEPKKVIAASAKELGIPYGVHVAMNAFTSPQTKFSEKSPSGAQRYPNNAAAEHAVRHMQQDGNPWTIHQDANYTDPDSGRVKRHSGYPANFAKAGHAYKQYEAGVPMTDWRNPPTGKAIMEGKTEGTPMFGPKTGPYHNSWLESTPDFFVSDVHSGGGFLPHLDTAKPPILDKETGVPKMNSTGSGHLTGKSEQEIGIESRGFHTMADHAAREAMRERGLGSVRQAQAAQWNEQRIRRSETDTNLRNPLDTEERSYPKKVRGSTEVHGQLGLQFPKS